MQYLEIIILICLHKLFIIFFPSLPPPPHLDLSGNQHGMKPSLDQEDTPTSFRNKVRSQNEDETSALIHTTSQIINVSLEKYKGRKT